MLNKYKSFKEKKKQAKDLQTEFATIVSEGKSEWGKIKIFVNGNREVVDVNIDVELLKAENKEKIQNGIKEAIKDATGMKFQMKLAKKMQELGGADAFKNLM